jgi:tetratricopeptide (TPR) repeat protein
MSDGEGSFGMGGSILGRSRSCNRFRASRQIFHPHVLPAKAQKGGNPGAGLADASPMTSRRCLALAIVLLLAAGCKAAAPLPPKAVALNRAGVDALAEGDLETADARFSLALEYNPHFVEALTNLGLVALKRGNFARARQLLARAHRLNPDVAQPLHGLGVLAEREHRPDRAAEYYREALRIDPGFAPARANLARLLFAAGMLEHARIQFKRLVEVAPNQPTGYRGLAQSLLRLGRTAEAEQVASAGHARFPHNAWLTILAARTEIRHGRIAEAKRMLIPLASSRDDAAASALSWLATAELAAGRPRYAVGAAGRALRLEPNNSVAVFALAMALHRLHDPGARHWLEHARKLAPHDRTIAAALVEETPRATAARAE